MRMLAPEGPVYQAGTLSGNPVAVAAGLATLAIIERPGFFEQLAASTQVLASGLRGVAHAAGIALASDSVGGMFGFFFASALPDRLSVVSTSDIDAFKQFFHLMLERGVYLAPSAYEAGFVSAAHTDTVIATTIDAAADAFEIMKVDRQQATLP
jgi:glutamate-1-semialdehyde 2,1-aminomutase